MLQSDPGADQLLAALTAPGRVLHAAVSLGNENTRVTHLTYRQPDRPGTVSMGQCGDDAAVYGGVWG
jgi:hypothetical protein